MRSAIMETLGPGNPSLLSVPAFHSVSSLGRKLLRLARELALLDFDDRKLILKKHNLGRNVPLKNPDRKVSSFATRPSQLKVNQELGFCIMELGLYLARACDRALGGHKLVQSLLDSGMTKGCLIHYHSILDGINLKQADSRKRIHQKTV
ncbi:uncharacterized protein LOC120010874 [Tripterygium wilfordii]|uniref:uncharacterized protein LOC120010874 n=1 Tax=Tripterygium wilfordii TaxID=458696 RepID=UPI0018F835A8|nr:uncharacterized protein LOC120010874 [Tripterygium wilfordii]